MTLQELERLIDGTPAIDITDDYDKYEWTINAMFNFPLLIDKATDHFYDSYYGEKKQVCLAFNGNTVHLIYFLADMEVVASVNVRTGVKANYRLSRKFLANMDVRKATERDLIVTKVIDKMMRCDLYPTQINDELNANGMEPIPYNMKNIYMYKGCLITDAEGKPVPVADVFGGFDK